MFRYSVKCTFHHVPADAVKLISSLIGVPTKYQKNKAELSCSCSLPKAYQIRSILSNSMSHYPQIWFSITPPNNSGRSFLPFGKNIANKIHVSFGSLLSTSKFFVHDTPLNDSTEWTVIFYNGQTLTIECQADNKINLSIRLTLSMKCIDKNIFVIDGDTYSDIIFNVDAMTTDVRTISNTKNDRYLEGQVQIN